MSIFNILSNEGSRDPWASNQSLVSPSPFHSQQQQQKSQQQQSPYSRLSISSASGSKAPIGSTSINNEQESSSLTSYQSTPISRTSTTFESDIFQDGNFSLNKGNIGANGSNSLSSGKNDANYSPNSTNINVVNTMGNGSFSSFTPHSIGQSTFPPFSNDPSHQPQRRFTWGNSSTSLNMEASSVNGANLSNTSGMFSSNNSTSNSVNTTTNVNLSSSLPFASSPILSSLPRYKNEQALPNHQTPIQTPASLFPSSTSLNSKNVYYLLKVLDDVVLELKSEFRLLEQENERLKVSLRQMQDERSSISSPNLDERDPLKCKYFTFVTLKVLCL